MKKGGKRHEVPCHPNLKGYLDDYVKAADIASDNKVGSSEACTKGTS
jgi:hypothetical protein